LNLANCFNTVIARMNCKQSALFFPFVVKES
jgi:hypothetical protein